MSNESKGFRSFTLDNGMKVNLIINRSAPLAEVSLYVRTGYAWEPDRLQGVSHVVEHNLMHASPQRASRKEFAHDRRAMGAWYDAGTTYDYTEYLLVVPRDHLKDAMEMLADGFFSPIFRRDVFESEMGAITQESRRKEDIPEPMVLEKLYSVAYTSDRRRRWRLGTDESLARIKLEDLERYFHDRYGPGNIVCTVGGDVDPDEAEKLAREVFGPVPAAEVKGEYSPEEPVQNEVRYMEIPTELGGVYWICGFHTPAFLKQEGYHLFDLTAAVLGGGRASRLIRNVQDRGLADRIEARSPEYDEYMMFNIYAETDADRLKEAESAILEEIFALSSQEVTEDELNRARNMVKSAMLMRTDDLRRHLEWLSVFEGRGGSVSMIDEYVDLLDKATPGQIRRTAEKYLTPQNLSICMLKPKKLSVRDKREAAESAEKAFAAAAEKEVEAEMKDSEAIAIPSVMTKGILEQPKTPVDSELDNGARIIFQPAPGNPTFALAALIRGGRFNETEETCGITDLMTVAMLKGTKTSGGAELTARCEALGVSLNPVTTDDGFGFTLYGPAASFDDAGRILGDILLYPAMKADDIENEKRKLINKITAIGDRPRDYSLALFKQEIFKNHPYGLPRPGSIESLRSLNRNETSEWREKLIAGQNLVISLSGDFTQNTVMDAFSDLFGGIEPGKKNEAPVFQPEILSYPRNVKIDKEFSQTSTVVGYPAAAASDHDSIILDLIATLCLGDGGRFYDEIRSKRGLAYVVHAINMKRNAGGAFFGFSATAPQKAEETRNIFLNEYRKLYESPPTQEELEMNKEYCLGQRLIRQRRTSLQRALAMAEAEIDGSGFKGELQYEEQIKAVTLETVIETARKYFAPGGHVILTVGK